MEPFDVVLIVAITIILVLILWQVPQEPVPEDGTDSIELGIVYGRFKSDLFSLLSSIASTPSSPEVDVFLSRVKKSYEDLKWDYLDHHRYSKVPEILEALAVEALYQAKQGWNIRVNPEGIEKLGRLLAKDKGREEVTNTYINTLYEQAKLAEGVSAALNKQHFHRAEKLWSELEGRYFITYY